MPLLHAVARLLLVPEDDFLLALPVTDNLSCNLPAGQEVLEYNRFPRLRREEFNGNRLAHADGILLPSCLNNSYVCHGDMLLKVRLPCKGSLTFHTLITSYRLPVPLLFLVMLTQAGDEKFRVALPAKTKCDTAG